MRLLDLMDRTMRSLVFWALRVVLTVAAVVIVMRDRMTDVNVASMILGVPGEIAPIELAVCIAIGLFVTLVIGMYSWSENDKVLARSGQEKVAYGLNYLSKNIVVAIAAGLGGLFVTGFYYSQVTATPDLQGCLCIGVAVAFVIGLGGESFLNKIVEIFRNRVKSAEARSEDNEPQITIFKNEE